MEGIEEALDFELKLDIDAQKVVEEALASIAGNAPNLEAATLKMKALLARMGDGAAQRLGEKIADLAGDRGEDVVRQLLGL